jgi:hypothetical protein
MTDHNYDGKIAYLKWKVNQPIEDPIKERAMIGYATRFDFNLGYLDIVSIAYRGNNEVNKGTWAVINKDLCWHKRKKEFVYEPSPSNRTQRFYTHTRFTLDEAIKIVKSLRKHVIEETSKAKDELIELEKGN